MVNEEFARVKIDQLLRDTDWRLTDGRSVRFEAGSPLISAGRIANVPLLVPPLALQAAYTGQMQRIEALARNLDAAMNTAEAMAAALSAEVFQ